MNALENPVIAHAAAVGIEPAAQSNAADGTVAAPALALARAQAEEAKPVGALSVTAAAAATTTATTMATATGENAASANELFGSFFMGADEFALPASTIREVVDYPDKMTAIPLSPAFLEGIFTLRGHVIPVLNLGKIFDSQAASADASHKVAIIDHEQIQIGIVFHSTGELLRVCPEQRSTLQYRDAASHGVIGGTIRLDGGLRLLQILDPAALISIENIPQVRALKSAGQRVETNHFHLQAERRQCVSFRVGGTVFAFEMNAIREIIDVPELKHSVLTSKLCIGRINLRGSAVAVVDFAKLLGMGDDTRQAGSEQRIVIARLGDASIGLLVDSVDNIFSYFPGDVLPIPLLSKTRAGMFGGCIHKEGIGAVIFLNHDEIFSRKEVIDMTRGHADLYQQENTAAVHQAKAGGNGQRKVYITFTMGNTYALEIRKIREIIDFSTDLIKAPSIPPFVQGMLKLRRQMITVLNLRCLYQMAPLADLSSAKILVIERGEERFGLMVDAVENIVTVSDSDRMPTPRMMRSDAAGDMRSEMQEVIELAGADTTRQTISVFEIDVFLERLSREMAAA